MKKRVNISLDEEIAKELKNIAYESHRNVSQWITDAVLENKKQENTKKKGSRK